MVLENMEVSCNVNVSCNLSGLHVPGYKETAMKEVYVPIYKPHCVKDRLRGPYLVPAIMSTGCSPITSLSASKCSGSAVSSQRRCSSQRIINRLRNTNPEKFDTMCKMHLSFILDLSGGSLEELLCEPRLQNGNNTEVNSTVGPLSDRSNGSLGETTGKPKRHHIFSRKRTSKGDKVTDIQTSPISTRLSQEAIDLIHPILEFVGRPENICQEGLFRKTGLLARQRQLRERLHTGGNISDIVAEFSSESYSSHDGANLIKTLLGELSEPLLTEKHYNVHGQVANMVRPDMTPDHQILMQGRQLQALQLLFLLLPRENMQLLECLLSLLHRVVQEPANKMTADTLGTMFAPHIILPRKMSACEIQQSASDSTRAVSFMIKHAPSLFQAPMSLIRDIDNYWAEVEETIVHSSTPNSYSTVAEPCHIKTKRALAVPPPDVVNTTVSFVDRAASQSAAAQTDTQTALAELYAHVSAMPKSAKQKKMIKQFNKANGPGTPMMTPQSNKPKSRTLGESIKRIVSRNHRRQPSGHSTNVNTVSPSIETNSTNATTPGSAVSSDRNRAAEASTLSPFDNSDNCDTPTADKPPELPRVPPPHPATPELVSPVKRLFTDEENCTTPTPASPHVTIVDMKVPCGDRTNTIHNSAQSKNTKSKCPMMTRKRKLQLMDIAVNKNNVQSTPIAGRLFSSETMRDDRLSHVYLGTCCRDAHVVDTRDRENLMLSSPVLSPKCHAPLVVTPDRRLDKPTAFISPITRTIQSASEVIQIQAMTPGSRRPMAVLQSP